MSVAQLDAEDKNGFDKLESDVIKKQLANCIALRDQASQQVKVFTEKFLQCTGAISVLEEQLKIITAQEQEAAKKQQELRAPDV